MSVMCIFIAAKTGCTHGIHRALLAKAEQKSQKLAAGRFIRTAELPEHSGQTVEPGWCWMHGILIDHAYDEAIRCRP